MRILKTYMVSALALGTMSVAFTTTDALANHNKRPGRGYGHQYVDVYVDAGRDTQLERAIGAYLVEFNPYVNIVYSPRYADVTISVNGYLSRPEFYNKPYGHYRSGYVSMDYNYKVRIKAGRRTIYKDRIYGEVTEPLRQRYGYHKNSSKAEKALLAFGLFIDIASDGKISRNYGRPGYNNGYGNRYGPNFYKIEQELRREAISRVAKYISHIQIPRKYGRY